MTQKILYCGNKSINGYYKIYLIIPESLNANDYKSKYESCYVLTADITEKQAQDWYYWNKYCVNNDKDGITETEEQYKIPLPVIKQGV